MALIKCPSCGADISDQALQCPKCGHNFNSAQSMAVPNVPSNVPTQDNSKGTFVTIILPALILFIFGILGGLLGLILGIAYVILIISSNPRLAKIKVATASDLANWRTEIPLKGFSNSVRISTIIVSILAIIISIIILVWIPSISDMPAHVQEYITDIFSPIKIGLYVMIAVNLITAIIAFLDRNNNSHAVATGAIGLVLACGIIMLLINSQEISEVDFMYLNLSENDDLYANIRQISFGFMVITFVIYMIIAATIAAVRRLHVAGLMAYPAADKQAMQKYCNSRITVIFWTLFSIIICVSIMVVIHGVI